MFQIYVDKDDLPGPYASEPIVKQLVAWLKTAEGKMMAETSGEVSGYYTYPPLPSNLQAFKDSYPLDKPLQVSTSGNDSVNFCPFYWSRFRIQTYVASCLLTI